MVGTMRTIADYTLGTAIVLIHLVMIALRGEDLKSLSY
jgi:hypothetical protein